MIPICACVCVYSCTCADIGKLHMACWYAFVFYVIHACIYMYAWTCVKAYGWGFIFGCIHSLTYNRIIHTSNSHTCTHTCAHASALIHAHTNIYIYIHTYMYALAASMAQLRRASPILRYHSEHTFMQTFICARRLETAQLSIETGTGYRNIRARRLRSCWVRQRCQDPWLWIVCSRSQPRQSRASSPVSMCVTLGTHVCCSHLWPHVCIKTPLPVYNHALSPTQTPVPVHTYPRFWMLCALHTSMSEKAGHITQICRKYSKKHCMNCLYTQDAVLQVQTISGPYMILHECNRVYATSNSPSPHWTREPEYRANNSHCHKELWTRCCHNVCVQSRSLNAYVCMNLHLHMLHAHENMKP
jgi:hypothetical protein